MSALVEHEEGHAALGVDAARKMELQLMQMGDRSSCDQLETDADALARDIIAGIPCTTYMTGEICDEILSIDPTPLYFFCWVHFNHFNGRLGIF